MSQPQKQIKNLDTVNLGWQVKFKQQFPTNEFLPKILRIQIKDDNHREAKDSLTNYLNLESLNYFPESGINWICRQNTRGGPKNLSFQVRCLQARNTCRARLFYQYDGREHCYYLKNCNTVHKHVDYAILSQKQDGRKFIIKEDRRDFKHIQMKKPPFSKKSLKDSGIQGKKQPSQPTEISQIESKQSKQKRRQMATEEVIFHDFFPTRDLLPSILKISNRPEDSINRCTPNQILSFLNLKSSSKYGFGTMLWAVVRKNGQYIFICKNYKYKSCNAHLTYVLDEQKKQYYLTSCENQHTHYRKKMSDRLRCQLKRIEDLSEFKKADTQNQQNNKANKFKMSNEELSLQMLMNSKFIS